MAFAATLPSYIIEARETDPVIGLVATFNEAYTAAWEAHEQWIGEKEQVEALPDCPPFESPGFDREKYRRNQAFMAARGIPELADRSNTMNERLGAAINAVFATPARTVQGALEMVRICYLAFGDHAGYEGDGDLDAWQEESSSKYLAV